MTYIKRSGIIIPENILNTIKKIQNKVIPINMSISNSAIVINYDEINDFIKSKNLISVRECSCRNRHKKCNHLNETCFSFNEIAEYAIEKNYATKITTEEALEKINQIKKDKLIFLVNSSKYFNQLCSCCICCCSSMRLAKFYHPDNLSKRFKITYNLKINENCTKCKLCVKACPMEAIENFKINLDKCISCGICKEVCKFNAIEISEIKGENECWKVI